MNENKQNIMLCYFICLFVNVFLIRFYKTYYLYELFFIFTVLLWSNNYQINTIILEKPYRPTKKRKIKPCELDWCNDYW